MPFKYIHTLDQYPSACAAIATEKRVAADIETCIQEHLQSQGIGSALDAHSGRVSIISVTGKTCGTFVFDILLLKAAGADILLLLNTLAGLQYCCWHNAKFDLGFIYREFGILLRNTHCTLVLAQLHANSTGSRFARMRGLSLKALARDFLNIQMKGKGEEQVSDWSVRPQNLSHPQWVAKLKYAANDTTYLLRLHDTLWHVLTTPLPDSPIILNNNHGACGFGMLNIIKREFSLIATICTMELNGLPASKYTLERIQDSIYDLTQDDGELFKVASQLATHLGLTTYPSLWADYDLPTPETLKQLNNPAKLTGLIKKAMGVQNIPSAQTQIILRILQILDMLSAEEGGGEVAWADAEEENLYSDLLAMEQSELLKSSALAKLVVQYKKLQKQFGMNLAQHINPITGCIHSKYNQLGAATGRSSSSNP